MTDESYIKLTLEIAKKGSGYVSPNPLVGCLLVKESKIISAGYHEKFGEAHAEINAINKAGESLNGATLYVNLEPCSHHGKTPPCVDKIIESGIKRVVIGTLDVNPLVSGQGVQKLLNNGIEVKVGVLEKECTELNRFFFKYIKTQIPYVTLKTAQTLDGKIADGYGNSKWITSEPARQHVHLMRSQYDAVLVGRKTIDVDNPSLTVRLIEGRNPIRIVLDSSFKIKLNSEVLKCTEANTIIVTSIKSKLLLNKIKKLKSFGVRLLFVNTNKEGKINLKSALKKIGELGIASILIEGGSEVFSSFVKQNLFDEIITFISPKLLGNGVSVFGDLDIRNINKAKLLRFNTIEKIGDDLLVELRR
ncbi:MAG: bifunctional diaminohydroxyphosphoribosylaminopyrimidine deaminase/5-amino-6-(5-phosphoribosylamino)uracil reductase RibD [Ignavibacteria bacterium]|nr:bifunctional diaminohydroxyphosphoribosylaminopyrimidine deaminase/5-amino-6-(5-phosphoribosylamino)uracil reductase RibD [Ignavibacteria bacterium]